MKQKDLVFLLLAVVIFLVAGYVGYTQLVPKKAGAAAKKQVETVGLISDHFDQQALTQLGDTNQTTNFSIPVPLTGLGNPAPFGP
jgi:flagellar basal body-associated protein FliL